MSEDVKPLDGTEWLIEDLDNVERVFKDDTEVTLSHALLLIAIRLDRIIDELEKHR